MKYRLSPRLTDTGKRRFFSVKKARFLKRTGREYDNIYIEKQRRPVGPEPGCPGAVLHGTKKQMAHGTG
jgi:hypothetical protein